jgi:putative ABC transport system permease protein
MFRFALQSMRARRHSFVGAFLALSFAVALVTACGILMETGVRATPPVRRFAAAPVVVAARQTIPLKLGQGEDSVESVLLPERARIPAALIDRVASVEGVQAVVADRSIPATLATVDGRILSGPGGQIVVGYGWSSAALTPYSLTAGRAPSAPGEVVLDSALAGHGDVRVGSPVRITSTNGTSSYRVVGLAAPGDRGWQGSVFVTDILAASLTADPAKVDALALRLDTGANAEEVAERVRRTVGERIAVYTGDDRGKAESIVTTQRNEELIGLAGVFGSFAVLLAIFVVAATLGLSVLQRGREIALLRAVGAKPRQIRWLLVGEAVLVALGAGLLGVAPGVLLGFLLFHRLRAWGVVAETTHLVVGPLPVVAAVAVGVVAAGLAARLAGRRAARIRPTAALVEAAVEPKRIGLVRLLLGLAFLSGGVLLSATAFSLEGEAAAEISFLVLMVLMVAGGLLGPLLARTAVAACGPLIAVLSPTSGFLAMANVRTRARRFASACAPIVLGIAFSLVVIGTMTVQAKATEEQSRDRVHAELVLAAPGGLPGGLVDEVRRLPGVEEATGVLPTSVGAQQREFDELLFQYFPAVGISPEGIDKTLDLDVREGSVADLPLDGVAVSVDRARRLGVGVGDEVSLWLGDGDPRTLRVVATYASALGFGEFVLARDVVAPHVSVPMDARMLVRYEHGVDRAELDAQLVELLERTPGLTAVDRATMQVAEVEEASREAGVNYLLIAVLLAFLALGAANSLVMATGERSKELALLRLVGTTRRQVARMIRFEAVAVIGFSVFLGALTATATLVPFSLAVADSAVPYVPWEVLVGVVACASVLGFGACELPARNALRRDPIDVIGAQA